MEGVSMNNNILIDILNAMIEDLNRLKEFSGVHDDVYVQNKVDRIIIRIEDAKLVVNHIIADE